jgi:hypothetical protein
MLIVNLRNKFFLRVNLYFKFDRLNSLTRMVFIKYLQMVKMFLIVEYIYSDEKENYRIFKQPISRLIFA